LVVVALEARMLQDWAEDRAEAADMQDLLPEVRVYLDKVLLEEQELLQVAAAAAAQEWLEVHRAVADMVVTVWSG
jgi:hypothetical protein